MERKLITLKMGTFNKNNFIWMTLEMERKQHIMKMEEYNMNLTIKMI